MPPLTESQLLGFLLQVAVLLATARVLAEIMKRFGQAPVIGELLAGIALGPSILGSFWPAAYAFLFPASLTVSHLLEAFAWFGAILLLLYIGLEVDLQVLRQAGERAPIISAMGILVPFAGGFLLGWFAPERYLAAPDQRLIFALFLAVALSVSAVPVIAKILIDFGLMRRELGLTILAAGIVDDSLGWLMLSVIAGLATRGAIDLATAIRFIAEAALFVGFCYFAGFRLTAWFLRWVDDRSYIEHAKLTAIVVVALVFAVLTQAIGLHAVFGAFVAGMMVGNSARVRKSDLEDIKGVTLGVMAPLFFAYSGMRVDLSALGDPLGLLVVLAVACASKFIGCSLGGIMAGLRWREAFSVAVGMNARGGVGIIVALIGLSLGVLTPATYTIIVLVAIATSLMAPPLLNWSLRGIEYTPEESERMERDRLLARLPLSREGAKLLVLSGGGPHADLAAHIASAFASHPDASVTVFHASVAGEPREREVFAERFERIKGICAQSGAPNVLPRFAVADSIAEAIAQESERGYDAIFAGASHERGYDEIGGDVLRELVFNTHAPVIIVRNSEAPVPFKRILAPVTGAAFARVGAAVAIQYARVFNAKLTALHVRERSTETGSGSRPDDGREFVDEIELLGRQLKLHVEARVAIGRRAEDVIVATAHEGGYDLLVMGVLYRSSEQRLYFGPKVRQILSRTRCSVALVVPPQ
jgi:Kef-type K+ transport system membrane component KefB/nucleotide-binding universal stress UspA family protein